MSRELDAAFFRQPALLVARELLGCVLVSRAGGRETRFVIAETEAYHESERGAHCFGGRKTARNAAMFEAGGVAYVYFTYGMHWMLNVVTGEAGTGEAVLLRAGWPLADSWPLVRQRRFGEGKAPTDPRRWCDGPAKLTQAAAVERSLNGCRLAADAPLQVLAGTVIPDAQVVIGPRVGIDYAGADAALPWRFRWVDGR
jgi:DNA-3-methyladenine glycosylase